VYPQEVFGTKICNTTWAVRKQWLSPLLLPHWYRRRGARRTERLQTVPIYIVSYGSSRRTHHAPCRSAGAGMYPIVGEESIMSPKEHGTSKKPVQKDLKWNCDYETADRSETPLTDQSSP